MCLKLCTIVVHSSALNISGNLPSYPPDNHHSSDGVYRRAGGVEHNLNTALLVTVLCVGWSVGCSSCESSDVRLCPHVNDLLKLSEYYRIGQLFWPILSTIGLSDFHTIVLTLVVCIDERKL